jgi:hypothetical protein
MVPVAGSRYIARRKTKRDVIVSRRHNNLFMNHEAVTTLSKYISAILSICTGKPMVPAFILLLTSNNKSQPISDLQSLALSDLTKHLGQIPGPAFEAFRLVY